LEFAYSLAPPSMKSTVMSLWQLTGMMGNTIATVVVGLNKQGPLAEFLLYSGLMFGAALALHGIFRGRPRSEAVPASG
jgi:POT family proton-dependent oligopeptide transporter